MAWRELVRKEFSPPEKVKILDTTLRDGEQTPGVSLTPEEKLEIARQLDALGVDIIEAGFPITSKGEKEAVKLIAREGLNAEICGLARCEKQDMDDALDCDVDSVHVFIATSKIHMDKKLRLSRDEVVRKAVESVEYCKDHGVTVEFSAEDATRSEINFLLRVFREVVDAGADRIDIPDTVGVCIPIGMFNLVRKVKETVNVPIAVHCHDDMGLAVANSLAGVEAGAEEIHSTINGLGERAGNASLEEVVVSLKYLYGISTNVRLEEIYKTSQLVSRLTGINVQPNKAIVGENAFAHESGIHTHGVVTSPETYEPISPVIVGRVRRLVAGKHAGRHGIKEMLSEMGISLTDQQLKEVTERVKSLGDKGKEVTDTDLLDIAEAVALYPRKIEEKVKLKELLVVTGNKVTPTSTVRLEINGNEYTSAGIGVGPVDASIKAVKKLVGEIANLELVNFKLDAITGGTDALANVVVKLRDENGRIISGRGVREDIVMAGVEAIINAANKILSIRHASKNKE